MEYFWILTAKGRLSGFAMSSGPRIEVLE